MNAYLDLISPLANYTHTCPLTGQGVNAQMISSPSSFYYETEKTGKVLFSDQAFNTASNLTDEEKQILAGICRNITINGEKTQMIRIAFLSQLKNQEIPYNFDTKCRHIFRLLI